MPSHSVCTKRSGAVPICTKGSMKIWYSSPIAPSMRDAEIGVDHRLIAFDLFGRAVGNLDAVVEHHDAVGEVHHHAHVMFDQCDRGAVIVVHVEHKARHVFLLLDIHAGHRLVKQQQLRLHGERAPKLHTLLQPVGQPADRHATDFLDLEEIDDLLDAAAMLDHLALPRTETQQLQEELAVYLERAARHDVVERRHAAKQGYVLERPRNAPASSVVRTHLGVRLAFESDTALLRLIESVDDVEHRGLAGAIRPDDGAALAFADVEGNVADRLNPAERQRYVFHRQQHIADRNFGSA